MTGPTPSGTDRSDLKRFGAALDGTTDDTVAVVLMLDACGYAAIPPRTRCRISALTLGRQQALYLGPGSLLFRSKHDPFTGPMITLSRNHGSVIGDSATLWSQNASPDGVVRFERAPGFACEWSRVSGLHIRGPGGNTEAVGIAFFGSPTFQNRVADVTISDVTVGVRMSPGANMNQVAHSSLYNIGTAGLDLDGTADATIGGITVASSPDIIVIRLRGSAQRNSLYGIVAEPGGHSTFMHVDSGCTSNSIHGVSNTTELGRDEGRGTLVSLPASPRRPERQDGVRQVGESLTTARGEIG